jgi:ubiquinone/menaquinone biosynthesis C-methylase UbiE
MRESYRVCGLAGLLLLTHLSSAAWAQLSSRPAEEWIQRLERPERVAGLRIDEIVARLELKPGQVVADLGAGPGLFAPALAKAVGPGGKVYAVDIDQGFIDHMNRKFAANPMPNVFPLLGKFTDPALPEKGVVDMALFHDVLHHIEDRAGYLKNLEPYMSRTGRIAVIDLDPATGSHKDEPALQVSKETSAGWMAAIGFVPEQDVPFGSDKWFVIYKRK